MPQTIAAYLRDVLQLAERPPVLRPCFEKIRRFATDALYHGLSHRELYADGEVYKKIVLANGESLTVRIGGRNGLLRIVFEVSRSEFGDQEDNLSWLHFVSYCDQQGLLVDKQLRRSENGGQEYFEISVCLK